MTNDNDLIRRGAAMTILSNGSQTWGEAVAAIAALPAVAASQPADPVINAGSCQPEPMYLICKHGGYYRPNCQGYTSSIHEAGRYTLAEAENETHPNGPDGPRDGMTYIPAPPVNADSRQGSVAKTLAEELASTRASYCSALPGSDEEFKSYLLGFDHAAEIALRQQVAVKPLVWEEDDHGNFRAHSIRGGEGVDRLMHHDGSLAYFAAWGIEGEFDTPEAAQAAIEAEIASEILAAIDVQPDPACCLGLSPTDCADVPSRHCVASSSAPTLADALALPEIAALVAASDALAKQAFKTMTGGRQDLIDEVTRAVSALRQIGGAA